MDPHCISCREISDTVECVYAPIINLSIYGLESPTLITAGHATIKGITSAACVKEGRMIHAVCVCSHLVGVGGSTSLRQSCLLALFPWTTQSRFFSYLFPTCLLAQLALLIAPSALVPILCFSKVNLLAYAHNHFFF